MSHNIKNVILTFFQPHCDDGDSKNEALREKVRQSGLFSGQKGTMYRTREAYDTYRHGGAYPLFHIDEDHHHVEGVLDGKTSLLDKDVLDKHLLVQQGVYTEVSRILLAETHSEEHRQSFIALAYKSLTDTADQQLLDNWKTWTGVRAILQDFGEQVPVNEVVFYARQTPHDFDVFGYIVLIRFETSRAVRQWVLYYLQRLRVERWFGYMTLYAVAPNFSSGRRQPTSEAAQIKTKST